MTVCGMSYYGLFKYYVLFAFYNYMHEIIYVFSCIFKGSECDANVCESPKHHNGDANKSGYFSLLKDQSGLFILTKSRPSGRYDSRPFILDFGVERREGRRKEGK